jgi:hypothetical protein
VRRALEGPSANGLDADRQAPSPRPLPRLGFRGRRISRPPMQRITRHPRRAAIAEDGQVAAVVAPDVQEVVGARDEPSGNAETVGAGDVEKVSLRHREPLE